MINCKFISDEKLYKEFLQTVVRNKIILNKITNLKKNYLEY